MKHLTVMLCVLTSAQLSAQACDLCSVYSATEAKESKPGLILGVFEQYTYFGTLQEDGHEVSNPADQKEDSAITQFIIGYQFNPRFGLQVNVPMIYRWWRRPEGTSIQTDSELGLGDVSVVGNVLVYQHIENDWMVALHALGGVKFPTGDADRLKEELNETPPPPGVPESAIHGHDLAFGSGSYDGIVGGTMFARWKRLFATGTIQYAIRTIGFIGYRYANDLTWSGGPGAYLWLKHEDTLSLQFNISGESKGPDRFQGEDTDDTSVTAVYLGPEFAFTWHENLSALVGVDVPVLQHNSALQIVPDYRVRAAATWRY